MIARQAQDLEDSAQAILTITNIDGSIGAQLDNLGRFVGQARVGLDDATYRQYLRARILANKSSGTSEALYRVFTALLGLPLRLVNAPVKTFLLHVNGAITRAQAMAALDFLIDSKEAGAHGILVWQETPTAALFTLDSGPGLDVGLFAGAASV